MNMTPEAVISKLRCPACALAGKAAAPLIEAGTVPAKDARLPQLFCPACRTPYAAEDGVFDLAGAVKAPRLLSSQWLMEFQPLILVYERIWRPIVTIPFSGTDWEMRTTTDLLELAPGHDLLDLACGPGNFTRHFAKIIGAGTVVGADLSWPMLKQGVRELGRHPHPNIQLTRADVSRWPFAKESFDRIHCAGALHLFPAIDKVFAAILASLKPGGIFVGATYGLGENYIKRGFQRYVSAAHGLHWFDPAELRKLATGAGFVDWHYQTNKQGIVFKVRKPAA